MTYKVFFHQIHAVPELIDLSMDDGVSGLQSRLSADQLRRQYPALQVATRDEFEALRETALRQPVTEIDEETFETQLEILPPDDLVLNGREVSFKCCERYSGRITSIYAAIGTRYFHLRDVYSLPHSEIMVRVREYVASHPAASAASVQPTGGGQ